MIWYDVIDWKFLEAGINALIGRCLEETQSDYVIFSNFNVNLIDRKMSPLCGSHVMTGSTFVVSDGNFFRVSFKSNDVYDAVGFNAYYEFRQFKGTMKLYSEPLKM